MAARSFFQRGTPPSHSGTARVLIGATNAIGALTIALGAMGSILILVTRLLGGTWTVDLSIAPEAIDLPRPSGGTAAVEDFGGYDVTALVAEVSSTSIALTVAVHAVTAVAALGIGVALLLLAAELKDRRSLSIRPSRAFALAAISIAVFGSAAEVLTDLMNNSVARDAVGLMPDSPYWAPQGWSVSFLPITVGVLFALVALVLQRLHQAQRDTEGLV